MKIAYVTSRFPHFSTFVLDEMLAMEELGHELIILAGRPPQYSLADLPQRYRELRATIVTVPWLLSWGLWRANIQRFMRGPLRYLAMVLHLVWQNKLHPVAVAKALAVFPKSVYFANIVQSRGVSWVHAHSASHPTIIAWVISQLTSIPYSFTGEGFDVFVERSVMLANPMLREKILQSRFMVSVGNYMKEYLVQRFGRQIEPKILVIPYGIRLSLFHNNEGRSTGRSELFRIVSVGNYVPKKGHEYLIDACALLKRRGVPFHCTIIGAGDRESYRQRVLAYDMETEVELCGIIQNEELPHRLKEADVFVLACILTPSGDRDATPSVLKEALAVERPVISTPVSSIPELVEHGRTGLLVPPQDAEALANALALLASDPDLRAELGKQGRERVALEFNVEHNVRKLAAAIQECLP